MYLEKIKINNFKGTKELELEFDKKLNSIKGCNGTGKSTVKEAYLWVLGNEYTNIIPSENNREIPNLEIRVAVTLNCGDYSYTLSRVQKESYKTNKETNEKEKKGNESYFYIDNIEYSKKEYLERISNIFNIDYKTLLVLSDKDYFNLDHGTSWKWNDRRELLLSLCDKEVIEHLIKGEKYNLIREDVEKGTNVQNLKKTVDASIKECKDIKGKNMFIIEKNEKDIIQYNQIDVSKLNLRKAQIEHELNANDTKKIETQISLLKSQDNERLNSLKIKLMEEKNKGNEIIFRANELKATLVDEAKVNEELEILKKGAKCPTCHQDMPKEYLDKKVKELENKLLVNNETKDKISILREEYKPISDNIKGLESQINDFEPSIELIDLEDKLNTNFDRKGLEEELNAINRDLSFQFTLKKLEEENEKLNKDNFELTKKENELLIKKQQIEDYVIDSMKLIESSVNSMFTNGVSFSLFNANYNGTFDETCVAMYNGKTYKECSTGEKNVLNYEIVCALQNKYDVSLPIVIDDSESVTRQFIDYGKQLIKLKVANNEKLELVKGE